MKENSEFKPVKLRLEIDLVSYPAWAEGLGKYDKQDLLFFFIILPARVQFCQAVRQSDSRDAFLRLITLDLRLDCKGFTDASQEYVKNAWLLGIKFFLYRLTVCRVQDAEVGWRQTWHQKQIS